MKLKTFYTGICLVLISCTTTNDVSTQENESLFNCTKNATPEIWAIMGQSNAEGESTGPGFSLPENVAMEFKGFNSQLVPYQEPIGEWVGPGAEDFNGDGSVAAKSKDHNLMWKFAQTYHDITGHQVIVVTGFRGATALMKKTSLAFQPPVENFTEPLQYPVRDSAVIKINKAQEISGAPLKGIIWFQGEYEAMVASVTKEEYKNALRGHVNDLISQTGAPTVYSILIHKLRSDGTFTAGEEKVNSAQKELAQEAEMKNKFKIIYDAQQLPEAIYRNSDYIHFNAQGLDKIGQGAAENLAKILGC